MRHASILAGCILGRGNRRDSQGFTLIELLIVVAIISILAAIAVPNFMEAQIRAKVGRVMADQRTLATAIEMYFIDNQDYMPYGPWGNHGDPRYLNALSTPISYLSAADGVSDPFIDPEIDEDLELDRYGYYSDHPGPDAPNGTWQQIILVLEYFGERSLSSYRYCVTSSGPNQLLECDDRKWDMFPLRYNPTNGTISDGDVIRFGP
jgi:prepilin-type N-terminal cleavage/methylation domain-containing protein